MSRLHHVLLSVALLSAGCVSTWAQGGVVDLHDSTFEHDTQAASGQTAGVWFVKFYAPWCGHCRALAPDWEALASRLDGSGVVVARLDCDRNPATCDRFDEHVRSFPTLLLFRDRGLYAYRGARDVDALEAFAREGYAVDPGASRRPVPPEPTRFRRLFSALTRRLAVEMIRAYDLTAAAMKTASGDYRRVARAFRREGVGGALSAVRRAFADAPKTYGCAALLVSVLGICLALVAALASAPIKRHPGSTKRKSE